MEKNKIKILVVFHNENIRSGATKSLSNIIDYLISTNKYIIEVVFPKKYGTAVDYYKDKNIKVHSYQYGNLMQNMNQNIVKRVIKLPVFFYRYIKIKKEARKAANDLSNNKYDIVYSNTSSIIFGALLNKYLKCKSIWHIREYRIKDHRIKFFLGEKAIKRIINDNSDKVLFVSNSVMEYHNDIIPKEKCFVTYNSYSNDYINPKINFNMTGILNILIAGDIKPSKGQFDIVKAIKICNEKSNNFCLHIAGKISDTKYYKQIQKYIKTNNMQNNIIIYGHVDDMKKLRNNMDIGVISSTNEAFGRTTIEGMLSMLAIIGRKTGGTIEQIDNNETGLFYDGTIKDLADKLLYLNSNREFMKKIAINGYNASKTKYTNNSCEKKVEQIIDMLIRNRE